MQGIFEGINHIFRFIGPLSDFLWEFPTNFEYYAKMYKMKSAYIYHELGKGGLPKVIS